MRPSRFLCILAALSSVALAGPAAAAPRPPTVVAVMGEGSLNVLHHDFRTADGEMPEYPPGMPEPRFISLPRGDFGSAMAALERGPLAHMEPNTLYAIRGTRLLVWSGSKRTVLVDPTVHNYNLDGRHPLAHGTGVTGAAIGGQYGANDRALALFVPGMSDGDWSWVAGQKWVDIATMSSYEPNIRCERAMEVRAVTRRGGLVFSSSGNTTDEAEAFMSPNGLPEVYQVGGVDEDGQTWLPGHTEESDPFYSFGTVMRPYETGALFSFRAPAPDSYEGSFQFGGTSGATPLTAGWASKLIQEARTILDVRGSSGRFLARAHAGRRLPSRGPLADGDFTARELTDLLHHTARPAEPASALRYFLEGYGAVDEKTISSAMKVLRGDKAEPARSQEDEAHRQTEAARAALFSSERCGMSPLAVGRSDE